MIDEKPVTQNQDLTIEKDPNDENLIEVSIKEKGAVDGDGIMIRVANKELLAALKQILVKEEDLNYQISKFYLEPIDYDVFKFKYLREKILNLLVSLNNDKQAS